MRSIIGDTGEIGIILTFVFSLLGIANVWWSRKKYALGTQPIPLYALISVFGSLLAFGSLFVIISQHYFEYNYAWSHSSKELDPKYQIACFWEGQEGSFLLWLLWNGVISLYFLARRNWVALAFILSIQAFLASMIMGVQVGSIHIGSSPFIFLRDAMPGLPVFKINPAYVPENGRGLNPLLQNYWMVIHPPTVFLGFALSA